MPDMYGDGEYDLAGFCVGIVDNAKIAEKAIPGCMLVCQTGKDMKAALSGYLQVLSDADASAVGGKLPADDFYYME